MISRDSLMKFIYNFTKDNDNLQCGELLKFSSNLISALEDNGYVITQTTSELGFRHNVQSFHEFFASKSISYNLNYSELEDCFEVETISPAKSECYYYKKCSDLNNFIIAWKQNK